MQVYISADMEGVSGLVDADDVQPPGRDYETGRLMMTEDVNAAVRGALAGGASDVLVNDAHGPMRNLLPDRLHPAARLIRGRPKRMGMLAGLDSSSQAVICVGFHARAGALGVLSHSFMGHEIEDMWLDDNPVGEIGLLHATATAIGSRVALLTGDDAACAEMSDWDSAVATVPVKYAHDRFAAKLRPMAQAREAIETAAQAAISHLDTSPSPRRTANPATLAVRWQSSSVAATLTGIPGVTLRDSRTIEVRGEIPALYQLLYVFFRVATSLTNQPPYC
ncbi:MAG: M55 family metallopeptidase [Mycobacteriales bacterium]